MSKLSLAKYHGAGNDFILIDDRAFSFNHSVASLCHRRFGIGADGVILLQPDKIADFRMRIFNSDGSEAESCGNGLRCLMKFIADLGLAKKKYRIATAGRIVEADYVGDLISVEMGTARDVKQIYIEGVKVHSLDTGVPHAVIFVPDVDQIDLMKEGAALRYHPFFQPRGTNVNFASIQPNGSIRVRTYERGLEGESLACGTGAAAVAAVIGECEVEISFRGGAIKIQHLNSALTMIGPAIKVFDGVFYP